MLSISASLVTYLLQRQRGTDNQSPPGRTEAIDFFVAQVAQICGGNAQANAVNSTDLGWTWLVRDQKDRGSNPLAPTNPFVVTNLSNVRPPGKAPEVGPYFQLLSSARKESAVG